MDGSIESAACWRQGLPLVSILSDHAEREVIRDTTYMVVLVSITLTVLLVMAYQLPAMQNIYGRVLGKPLPFNGRDS